MDPNQSVMKGLHCTSSYLFTPFLLTNLFATLWEGIYSHFISLKGTGPRSAVGNVSGYRCVSD